MHFVLVGDVKSLLYLVIRDGLQTMPSSDACLGSVNLRFLLLCLLDGHLPEIRHGLTQSWLLCFNQLPKLWFISIKNSLAIRKDQFLVSTK